MPILTLDFKRFFHINRIHEYELSGKCYEFIVVVDIILKRHKVSKQLKGIPKEWMDYCKVWAKCYIRLYAPNNIILLKHMLNTHTSTHTIDILWEFCQHWHYFPQNLKLLSEAPNNALWHIRNLFIAFISQKLLPSREFMRLKLK